MKTSRKFPLTMIVGLAALAATRTFAEPNSPVEVAAIDRPNETVSFLESLALGGRYIPMSGEFVPIVTGPSRIWPILRESLAMMARGNATIPMGGTTIPPKTSGGNGIKQIITVFMQNLQMAARGSSTIPMGGATTSTAFHSPDSTERGGPGGTNAFGQLLNIVEKGPDYDSVDAEHAGSPAIERRKAPISQNLP